MVRAVSSVGAIVASTVVGLAVALNSFDTPGRPGLSSLNLDRGLAVRRRATSSCELLASELGSETLLPSDPEYETVNDLGWSPTTWQSPSCIVQPRNTKDVQTIVSVLTAQNTSFAIRSGGHSPNPFDANIDGGVLVSLDQLDGIDYDEANQVVSLGVGGRWGAVYTTLEEYGVIMVGGRVKEVGVGGLTVGGGLSYLSDQYGMVADNVISFEIVLANASAVIASADSNPDLFWALKGGTNNFGIVTKITWPTLHYKDGWGGLQTFTGSQLPDVLQALHDYQTAPNKDLHANLIINGAVTNDTVILTLIYLDPVERPAAFAPFYALEPTSDTTGFYTLREIMDTFVIPPVPRWTWYTTSFVPTPGFYTKLSEILATAPEVATLKSLTGGSLLATFQPINENVVLEGRKKGGNALGLEPVDQTWLALDVAWWNAEDDEVAYDATESLLARIKAETEKEGIFLDYIFMNDASNRQAVLASYGEENVRKLRAVQQAYDPTGVFQTLVPGGQKIPQQ